MLEHFVSISESVGVISAFVSFDERHNPKVEILSSKEAEIYSKFISRKRQHEFIAGRIACKKAFLKLTSGKVGCFEKFPSISILNNETGAPFIENSDLFVSVSHSHGIAIASVSEHSIGVDVEQINPKRISALKRMSAECSPENVCDLTALWTLKESLGKALRTGIVEEFHCYDTVNFSCENGFYRCNFKNFPSYLGIAITDDKYAAAIVTSFKNSGTKYL